MQGAWAVQVAVIGLGAMGMGAALSCLRAGLSVTGCDFSSAARDSFAKAGGQVAASAGAIAAGTQAVLLLVVNAAQTEAALFGPEGCAARLAPGAVIIASATMGPDDARRLAKRAEEAGFLYLDAPVSGGAAKAAAGEMTVMASGSPAAFAKAKPVLDAVATKVWELGEDPGIGATVKVVHQLLAGVHIAVAAEAMALGIRAGADPQKLYDVVTSAAGNSWMFENRMARVLTGDDAPRSAVDIFVKDLGLVAQMARALDHPVPLASQAQQLFTAASAMGHGRADDGFVIRVWQALTGIPLPGDGKSS
ncbi:L-threonate dehydrogenase [Falsiroseomonas tokyonensis]|uniref:L-threonate dehydrogenase n=1 Tax=Falsiroseomonas tokyonensis TaxID=430521 RepID=A0ABV7BNN4_9PROT|nr:L-threonate dehydrogenase [Falsiroseomonas tokyonensis]MBU8537188.1 NAD(P)-dependent oxidoreductase [Falsiroseomonas tokyonensis]